MTARGRAADAVVVGGGVVGAATARALARRGVAVVLLEQGRLSAAAGSSRGTARIIAPAPYPDAEYLDSGLRALEEWRALERERNASLLVLDGALYAGRGLGRFEPAWSASAVAIERLSAAEVESRFGVRGLAPEPVLFQPEAGVLRADRARDALLRSAADAGAELHQYERVTAIEPGDSAATVRTTRRSWSCGAVVVTAGPWTNAVLEPLGLSVPVSVSSQSVAYFAHDGDRLPAVMEFDGDEPYSLIDPARGLKAALHRRGPEVSADDGWDLTDTDAVDRIRAWASARFPALDPRPVGTEACLYTCTSDERFILERHGPVIVASACNGQGFQFAPATGAQLAGLSRS